MSSGADNIVSNIMSDAQAKADEIICKATAESEKIIADGEVAAQNESDSILENAAKQADMRYQQIISEAKMNARRAELEAKEEVIEEAFSKATEDLTNMANTNDSEYVDALVEMIKEAAVEIGGGDLIVLLKEEDIPKVQDKLESIVGLIKSLIKREKPSDLSAIATEVSQETDVETTLEIGEPIDTIGGAILRTRNGEIQVNNTIESRMLRYKKSLRSEVAKTLFD